MMRVMKSDLVSGSRQALGSQEKPVVVEGTGQQEE
jgi:hypothetical protein